MILKSVEVLTFVVLLNSCVNSQTTSMDIEGSGKKCTTTYALCSTKLGTDKIAGEKGDRGDIGPKGIDGIPGKDGRNGTDGKDGLQGPPGPKGPVGPSGTKGIDGSPGKDGPKGIDGKDGLKGEPGPPGPIGEKGEKGFIGSAGKDGRDGINGKAGSKGESGPPGPAGAKGDKGFDGIPGKDGLRGNDGKPGEVGPPGPAGPTGDKGSDGLIGPKGDRGLTGIPGTPGTCGCPDIFESTADTASKDWGNDEHPAKHTCRQGPDGASGMKRLYLGYMEVYCHPTTKKTCPVITTTGKEVSYTETKPFWLSEKNITLPDIYGLESDQLSWLQRESFNGNLTLRFHCKNSNPVGKNALTLLSWNGMTVGPESTESVPFKYDIQNDGCSTATPDIWSYTDFVLVSNIVERLLITDFYIKDVRNGNQALRVELLELCFG